MRKNDKLRGHIYILFFDGEVKTTVAQKCGGAMEIQKYDKVGRWVCGLVVVVELFCGIIAG